MKVFINGGAGTTGLQIGDRLAGRQSQSKGGIELLTLPEDLRKSAKAAAELANTADAVFLCLPDDAATEAASLVTNPNTVIIDASTAHRVCLGWTYGFPELSAEQRDRIKKSKRISVPGCYASGFIALISPLVHAKLIPNEYPVTATGISGYSGAGKKGIAEYESAGRDSALSSARLYALSQNHKHIPEMQYHSKLAYEPMFQPVIDDFYSGMILTVPIVADALPKKLTRRDFYNAYKAHYESVTDSRVRIVSLDDAEKVDFLPANALADSDDMEIFVFGNDRRIMLAARFDNLGKGAAGAALQCFDIVFGK
ncbi:N-acetyl-gamma-glutamyl-phosphate reductase [Clostridia bacterium]|nr:N-acetyl-gamma-glutamyl-phosphate reductase [Clostridia bacterium]